MGETPRALGERERERERESEGKIHDWILTQILSMSAVLAFAGFRPTCDKTDLRLLYPFSISPRGIQPRLTRT